MTNICKGTNKNGNLCKNKIKIRHYCHSHISQFIEKPSECAVCFEEIDACLKCGHWIHLSCIQKSMKAECPICKYKLNLPEQMLNDIQKNACDAQQEWEEDLQEELRQNFITELSELLENEYICDIARNYFICDKCSELYPDQEIIVTF